ncbi:MAG: hypothetical protein RIS47_2054 [Bacteroidota bacterium]|jgi:hypothetical protein
MVRFYGRLLNWLIVNCLCGLFVVCSVSASAQLINIEKKRKLETLGFSGSVQLGGKWAQNVNKILSFENNVALQYTKNAHTFLLFNDMNIIQINNSNLANNGYRHLRYSYTLGDSTAYTLEVFGQHQNDVIKKLDLRVLAGGGMRFRLLKNDGGYVYFAPLLMWEHERFTDFANPDFDVLKWDMYLVSSFLLWERLHFMTITYYQPEVAAMGRFRLSHESSLDFPIFKSLSFVVSFSLQYDSYPAVDVPAVFVEYKNTLKYSF